MRFGQLLSRFRTRHDRSKSRAKKTRRPAVEQLEDRTLLSVNIQFDYRYDNGFFNTPEKKAVLQQAADSVTRRLNDQLAEIRPTGSNSWHAVFSNPSTTALVKLRNMVVPKDTLIIFVGSRTMPNNQRDVLAYADTSWRGPNSYCSGTRQWTNLVQTRLQTGTSTWGGAITFNSAKGWHFGPQGSRVPQDRFDLFSIAVHEVAHVLGFDSENPLFRNLSSTGRFVGSHAQAAHGKPVPMSNANDHDHWDYRVQSSRQAAAMIPYGAAPGFSRSFTELDFAALADIGWQVGSTVSTRQAMFDGDLKADRAVWRPGDGTWYVTNSSTGAAFAKQWGLPGDVPVNADFDGDGRSDFAVWRPSDGTWYTTFSSNGAWSARRLGLNGDIPAPGDFDGDGRSDFAVWRPSNGTWYFIPSSTGAMRSQPWGLRGDTPVPADYDGDGRTDLAVWRPSNGTWYILQSANGAMRAQPWGVPGDLPVNADYDGDGRCDLAVWRPSDGTWWHIQSRDGAGLYRQWGLPGDIPQPADFDADGRADFAVWRPSFGNWYITHAGDNSQAVWQWGLPGDIPVGSALVANLATRGWGAQRASTAAAFAQAASAASPAASATPVSSDRVSSTLPVQDDALPRKPKLVAADTALELRRDRDDLLDPILDDISADVSAAWFAGCPGFGKLGLIEDGWPSGLRRRS